MKNISRNDIRCENSIGRYTGEQSYHCYAMGKDGEWYSRYYLGFCSIKEAKDMFYNDVNKEETI